MEFLYFNVLFLLIIFKVNGLFSQSAGQMRHNISLYLFVRFAFRLLIAKPLKFLLTFFQQIGYFSSFIKNIVLKQLFTSFISIKADLQTLCL